MLIYDFNRATKKKTEVMAVQPFVFVLSWFCGKTPYETKKNLKWNFHSMKMTLSKIWTKDCGKKNGSHWNESSIIQAVQCAYIHTFLRFPEMTKRFKYVTYANRLISDWLNSKILKNCKKVWKYMIATNSCNVSDTITPFIHTIIIIIELLQYASFTAFVYGCK